MPSFIASTVATGTSAAPAVTHTPTVGNLLLLWITTTGTPTITGPAGWTAVAQLAIFTSYQARLFYRIATGSESYTCSLSVSESWTASVSEYSGMLNPPTLRTSAQREQNTATPSSGATGVPSVATDLVFSGFGDGSGAINSVPTGYTGILPSPGGVLHYGSAFVVMGATAYKVASGATEDPQWTLDSGRFAGVGVYVFEAAGGVGGFAAFSAWPDREEIAVAEVSALLTDPGALTLTGWTATGGQPNTWQTTVGNRTSGASGLGTLYRRVTGVRESGVELVARAVVGDVNSNAGSWLWDEPSSTLYVRTSGAAVDPDTRASVAARVTFYLASTSVVLDRVDGSPGTGMPFAALLAPSDGPTSVQEADDVLSGQKTTAGGQVVSTNGHGAWFPVAALDSGYTFRNQRAVFKLGGRYRGLTLAYTEFATVATMLIEAVTPDETQCVFTLRPLTLLADITIPQTPIFETEYPGLGEGVRGTYKAVLYGTAWTTPALTHAGATTSVWTVADASVQTLKAVHTVEAVSKADGSVSWLAEGQDYTVNLTLCTVTITAVDRWGHLTHDLRVLATGKVTGANGVVGSRGYLSTFAEIVEDLLRVYAGATTADIDAAGFAEAQLDARQELALYLSSPRALTSILSTTEDGAASLERSVHGTVQQTRAGQWTAKIWDPTHDAATLPALRKEDLSAFAPTPTPGRPFTAIRVHYWQDARSSAWSITDEPNAALATLIATEDTRTLFTFLRFPGDAEVMAKRYEVIGQYGDRAVDFVERGSLLALASVGDRVLVTYAPAAHPSGAYTSRAFTLVRLERGYAPRMVVSGQLQDVGRVTNRVGRWKAGGSPNYASATAAQRLLSGFWFASVGAPGGFDASRWW